VLNPNDPHREDLIANASHEAHHWQQNFSHSFLVTLVLIKA
jgi:hypothetical protein